jgi:hypothetical protein
VDDVATPLRQGGYCLAHLAVADDRDAHGSLAFHHEGTKDTKKKQPDVVLPSCPFVPFVPPW